MDFDFSEEQKHIAEEARAFLSKECSMERLRSLIAPPQSQTDTATQPESGCFDKQLWQQMVALGWTGVSVDETYGGTGLGYLVLCLLAQQLGHVLAPVPFFSSVCMFTEILQLAGTQQQKQDLLPKLVAGEKTGTVALLKETANALVDHSPVNFRDGALYGEIANLPDGHLVDYVVLPAVENFGNKLSLFMIATNDPKVAITPNTTLDLLSCHSRMVLNGVTCERVGEPSSASGLQQKLLDRVAVLSSFAQLGGAQACLDMALAYTNNRFAFGRPIASFQAIKHKLADIFTAIEVAKANAYYAAWALSSDSEELPLAAAVARVSATQAYQQAACENLQCHGGMGFTWEFDCHLYYRRAKLDAVYPGSLSFWQNRLVDGLLSKYSQTQPALAEH